MSPSLASPWILVPKRRPAARMRLFCFPYAGKGASVFARWSAHLPEDVELCAVQPPGKETRLRESPAQDLLTLARRSAEALSPFLDRPFLLFGHSLGGLWAFELTRALQDIGQPAPQRLFVSAYRSPELPPVLSPLHLLPDNEMIEELQRRYGSIPVEVMDDPQTRLHYLAILRADLKMIETYHYVPREPLQTPLSVFGGSEDALVPAVHLEPWRQHAGADCRLQMFPGGHFYLNHVTNLVIEAMIKDLHRQPEKRSDAIPRRTAQNARILLFPGQGSQHKGMGRDLWDAFPEQVCAADRILGYSVRDLCHEDAGSRLGLTQFTQPALYVVNTLTWLWDKNRHSVPPAAMAGHSLGEYNALMAAGVFSFEDGLRMVQRRGQLMAACAKGGMAAILGVPSDRIPAILRSGGLDAIDVANFNSPAQTVISGLVEDIVRAEPLIAKEGGRYVRLNVSAAFHSRFMREAQAAFAEFLQQFHFNSPEIPVIANVTAKPYPASASEIRRTLELQIASSVRWYESISYLFSEYGDASYEEAGPGTVLKRLTDEIRRQPLSIARQPQPERKDVVPPRPKKGTIFLYNGQGSQSYRMAADLYQRVSAFRAAMDHCSHICEPLIGGSLVDIIYSGVPSDTFDRLLYSNPANMAIGYALTEAFRERNIVPDAVIGYGPGELVAGVAAGGLTIENGLVLTVAVAKLVEQRLPEGAMLAVFASPDLIEREPGMFEGCAVAGVNLHSHFLLAGSRDCVENCTARLKQRKVFAHPLPLRFALNSPAIGAIDSELRELTTRACYRLLDKPLFTPARLEWVDSLTAEWATAAFQQPVKFSRAIDLLEAQGDFHYLDAGASGTLAGFVRHKLENAQKTIPVLSRFGSDDDRFEAVAANLARK